MEGGCNFCEEKGERKRESEKKKTYKKREELSHWVPKSRTTQSRIPNPSYK